MSMSPAAKKMTIGWGVLISLVALCVSLLGGFGGGMRAAGKIEARVQMVENCMVRHEGMIETGADRHSEFSKDVVREVSALQTDVKYIVKAVDEIKAEIHRKHE